MVQAAPPRGVDDVFPGAVGLASCNLGGQSFELYGVAVLVGAAFHDERDAGED
jgi:hypothetical protein